VAYSNAVHRTLVLQAQPARQAHTSLSQYSTFIAGGVPMAMQRVMEAENLAPGTIICVKESVGSSELAYTDNRTSFANHPSKKQVLHRGTVHVAVGFNDLSVLLHCQLADAPSGCQGPLRFVGFDAQPLQCGQEPRRCRDAAQGRRCKHGGGSHPALPAGEQLLPCRATVSCLFLCYVL